MQFKMDWLEVEDIISKQDFEHQQDIVSLSNQELSDRLRKTLQYAPNKNPAKDTLSYPVTKVAVQTFRNAAPLSYGKLGHRCASRIARDACLSPSVMLLAMIYIERLKHRNPDYLETISSSDLLLISTMIASKYLYDEGISDEVFNDEWAVSGLVDTDYMNILEANFLQAIDWRILIRKNEFYQNMLLLEARLAYVEGFARGWLTYTDASSMLESKKISRGIKNVVVLLSKMFCVGLVVYSGVIVASVGMVTALQTVARIRQVRPHPPGHIALPEDPQTFHGNSSDLVDMATENESPIPTQDQHNLTAPVFAPSTGHAQPDREYQPSVKPSPYEPVRTSTHHVTQAVLFLKTVFIALPSYSDSSEDHSICRNCEKIRESKFNDSRGFSFTEVRNTATYRNKQSLFIKDKSCNRMLSRKNLKIPTKSSSKPSRIKFAETLSLNSNHDSSHEILLEARRHNPSTSSRGVSSVLPLLFSFPPLDSLISDSYLRHCTSSTANVY